MAKPYSNDLRERMIEAIEEGATREEAYYRAQFEAAWRSFCKDGVTPSQPKNIRHLQTV
jgi:hypothetical protein